MEIRITGQDLSIVDARLVSNSVGIYECEFEFDEIWDGWQKTAVFQSAHGKEKEMVIIDDACEVPWETIVDGTILTVGVYGTQGEKRMPTVWGNRVLVEGGTPSGAPATPPTPDVYAQLLELAAETRELAENTPVIGDDGTWLIWDPASRQYVDSGNPSQGEKGAQGPKGDDGLTTSVTVNGETFEQEDGNINLGTLIREHQDLSDYRPSSAQDAIDAKQDEIIDENKWKMLLFHKPFHEVMKQYFELHGASDLTDLTELCDKWYAIARLGWTGGTTFSRTLSSGAGAKIGSNAGLTCAPSTPTLAATDNYAELPLFACVDVNEYLDADGKHHITAIDGIAGDFKRYDKSKIVSVMQMAPWIRWSSDSDTYTIEITDEIGKPGFVPWIDAVDLDGETRQWVTHVKYGFGYTGTASEYTACAGLPMRTHDISHNGQIAPIRTYWGNNRYCGKTSADDAWVKLMCYIKYASLSPETVGLYGCVNYYNNPLHPSIAETAVKRVIVPSSYLSSLVVGSTVSLGSASYGSVSTEGSVFAYKKILSLESVTIEDTAYCAVNIDTDEPFDTTTDLFLTTMMWYTGSTDSVRGNDGAVVLNNKSVCKIQGIEWGYGCYEVFGDTIEQYFVENGQNYAGYYICRDASKIVSSSAADHELMGRIACPASTSWNYIKKLFGTNNAPECMLPEDITGASSSTYTRDGCYIQNLSSGLREWLSFGNLSNGGNGGMSCVNGNNSLGSTGWSCGGRLSTTGNRGERAAL